MPAARVQRRGAWARALAVALLLGAFALAAADSAQAAFAPLERPGPKLTIPREKLRASLECSADVREGERRPVLLTPGTAVDSDSNFSWNYERLFAAEEIPYCTSDQRGFRSTNMSDVQTRGQYVTFAIRKMYRMAGRRITAMGHSQGGMIMRLSHRFWPDTRRKVREVIGIAAPNHGTDAAGFCSLGECPPAAWQQGSDSRFTAALNSRAETFRGIHYTEIYTRYDQAVRPPAKASSVSGPGWITNVAVQEICPGSTADHTSVGTGDAVAAALVLDALGHRGPAAPSRIDPAVCAKPWMDGIDSVTAAASIAAAAAQLFNSSATHPRVEREPRLRCWTKLHPKVCRKRRRQA